MKIVELQYNANTSSIVDISPFAHTVAHNVSGRYMPFSSKYFSNTPKTGIASCYLSANKNIQVATNKIGMKHQIENEFSISLIFSPGSSGSYNIFSMDGEKCLLDYSDGVLTFAVAYVDTDTYYGASYSVPDVNKAYHIVCSYRRGSIGINVNGLLRATASLPSDFKFISEVSGQTEITFGNNSAGSFFIDDISIDNKYLSEDEILMSSNGYSSPHTFDQIAYKSKPVYVNQLDHNEKELILKYSYPENKMLSEADTLSNVVLKNNSVYSDSDGTSVPEFIDMINFPIIDSTSHNQIDFDGHGISASYSFDGESYTSIDNHSFIPNFAGGQVYLKLTLSTDKSSRIDSLSFRVFESTNFYTRRSQEPISSSSRYRCGYGTTNILSNSSGIGVIPSDTLVIDNQDGVSCIEMMVKASSSARSVLLSDAVGLSMNGTPNVFDNIEECYVNGQYVTAMPTIVPGIWYHVVVYLTNPVDSNTIVIGQAGKDVSYSNIALYAGQAGVENNYYSYFYKDLIASTSDHIQPDDLGFRTFYVDKVVLSTS